jgi:hypothetical protein
VVEVDVVPGDERDDRGIVHEHVDAAEPVDGGVDHGLYVLRLGDVGADAETVAG